MILEKQLIMTIGMTENNWELTEDAISNSIDTFINAPIVLNQQQKFKDYSEENFESYKINKAIGCALDNVIIENNGVYADIYIMDCYTDLWKGKFDNWCIEFKDDKKSFNLHSIEVF